MATHIISMPVRYRDYYTEVTIDTDPIVMTSIRHAVGYRWKCNRCSKIIKKNTAAAQSHLTKHVREIERNQKK